ncbi:hypothetical protein M0R19_05095 [Candidatus Pacearchaeota archaeon]|jgi:hypothetical protein|nr:hypothetical protein [Candidatus Pacearchaeota archaeon]
MNTILKKKWIYLKLFLQWEEAQTIEDIANKHCILCKSVSDYCLACKQLYGKDLGFCDNNIYSRYCNVFYGNHSRFSVMHNPLSDRQKNFLAFRKALLKRLLYLIFISWK